ncbi:UNVERIFIED_CONTAM: hypothetical protein RMT77_010126 [Armadillidium vulgare]
MAESLQTICGIPVLVELSNHPAVKVHIFSTSATVLYDSAIARYQWNGHLQEVLSEVLKNFNALLKLIFPKDQIKFVGIEMLKWEDNVQEHFGIPTKFSQNFMKSSLFTSKGFIDEEKAARELINEPTISVFLKYKISCHYFLEDDILNLYEDLRNNEPNFKEMLSNLSPKTPIVMWSEYLDKTRYASSQYQPSITHIFKVNSFSYGMENKKVAAVKFSLGLKEESRKSEMEINEEEKVVYNSFCKCMRWVANYLDEDGASYYSLLSKDFAAHYNLIQYFISLMTKEELKDILIKEDLTFNTLYCFLHWPHQYQFMEIAQLMFESLKENYFEKLIFLIITFIHEECICWSYNSRQLLKKFWIESPSRLKRYIICRETEFNESTLHKYVIEQLFFISNFTSDDINNVYLILKEASPIEKKNIYKIQSKRICNELCSLGHFKIADFFFKVMDIDEETCRKFKKDCALKFFLMILQSAENIKIVDDEFFKWVVGTDDIDELKAKIFYELNQFERIEFLFLDFKEESQFCRNKILKLFLKTDDKIENWKTKILSDIDSVYSPRISYENPNWLNELLKYLGCSFEETLVIKRNLLLDNLPEIATFSFNCNEGYSDEEEVLVENISFLCLYEELRIKIFIDALRDFYTDSVNQKTCLFCMSENLDSSDEDDVQFHFEDHGTDGFISFNKVDEICSFLSTKINNFLRDRES